MIDIWTWLQFFIMGILLCVFFYVLLATAMVNAVIGVVQQHLKDFYNLHRSQKANEIKKTKKVKDTEDNILGKLIDKVPPEVFGDLAKTFLKVRDKKK